MKVEKRTRPKTQFERSRDFLRARRVANKVKLTEIHRKLGLAGR